MPTGLITISQYVTNPAVQLSSDDELEVRGWYNGSFVAGDGVTPVSGNFTNGQQGPYYSITPTLNGSGNLVVPAHEIQATTLSNPTANYIEQLWVNGAFTQQLMPNNQVANGWQIPTVYGDPIAFDEIATYNRARRLLYPPNTYFTADQTIQEIERIAGQLSYAGLNILGRTELDTAPDITSKPIAVGVNSDALFDNDHLIPASNVLTPQLYGAFADGTEHAITSQDITDNPQWIGSYSVGDSWDFVATQEAIYACFATTSTPGNVVWNAIGGTFYNDHPLYFPQGRYYINRQLSMVATGFNVYGSGKKASVLQWYGNSTASLLYCNAVAYGTFANLSFQAQLVTSGALMDMDWTGLFNTLKTNNISLNDCLFDCQSSLNTGFTGRSSYGCRISLSGGNAQGDTINLPNTSFAAAARAGLALGTADLNAQNVLGINVIGGGFIECHYDGILVNGGQVFVDGTFFGNQSSSESGTLDTQICKGGADVHVYSGAGASGLCSMRDIRSESDVLAIGVAHIDHASLVCNSIDLWDADASYQVGQLIHGTPGVGQKGAAGRTFMMVASATGTAYITPSGTSTWSVPSTVIIDPSASYTLNEWVGYGLTIRYPNGQVRTGIISANTATTVTASGIPFDFHTCAGEVCNAACGNPPEDFPCSQYKIGGVAGSTEPTWSSCPAGYSGQAGSGLGANITQGDTTLTSAFMNGARTVGDYVCVAGAGTGGGPLISRIAVVNSAVSVELDDAATATVVDAQWYVGTPLTDNQLLWIDIDYNAVYHPTTMKSVYLNAGRVGLGANADIHDGLFARPDWLRPGDFWGGGTGDNQYFSVIANNEVQAGDIFSAARIQYNLFQGTTGGYQQYAPMNKAAGMMLFDSGENGALLGEVGFGRGDGIQSATPGTATYISRNVAGIIGTIGGVNASGSNASPGEDTNIQPPLATGSGTPGVVNIRGGSTGAGGTAVRNSVDAVRVDGNTTANETRLLLWDITGGTFRRVSLGANDSGGLGFRALRVVN